MHRASPLAREAGLSAAAAAVLASALAWYGPPGTDLAAHAYQRTLFLQHGFTLWNNFWYAGRYSFVTYSVLYYPLAAVLGIRLLAVATIATAALAFAVVLGRQWGPTARWSSRTFALVWAGIILSAAFPFALGAALALLALWALQRHRRWQFALFAVLTLAASPVAFMLLGLIVIGLGIAQHPRGPELFAPAAVLVAATLVEVVLWRLFPGGGRYPFSFAELIPVCIFCAVGAAVTWTNPRARLLRWLFPVYLAACIVLYLVPSDVGENVARLRYAAIPVAVLALSLRDWRPRLICIGALALAISWNLSPLVASYAKGSSDPAAAAAYWAPAITYLSSHMTPSYRVEAVDTTGHWAAVYLPRAGIPLARGWFRQDDFPQNEVLYGPLGRSAYTKWLHQLGVRYVVLTRAPVDYSARGEAALLESGRSGLVPVLTTRDLTVFLVPHAVPLVTGPGRASVVALDQDHVTVQVTEPGAYRLAIRYSPYWTTKAGCVMDGKDGMLVLVAARGGVMKLSFDVQASKALEALAGTDQDCKAP
jgi:hypothetical protein